MTLTIEVADRHEALRRLAPDAMPMRLWACEARKCAASRLAAIRHATRSVVPARNMLQRRPSYLTSLQSCPNAQSSL